MDVTEKGAAWGGPQICSLAGRSARRPLSSLLSVTGSVQRGGAAGSVEVQAWVHRGADLHLTPQARQWWPRLWAGVVT